MRYFVRAVKYFLMLVSIFLIVTFAMNFVGQLQLTPAEQLDLFMANNGALKIAFLVVLSALYPLFGFVERRVDGSLELNAQQVMAAMESSGLRLVSQCDGVMYFCADNFLRRVTFLFEDRVSVEQRGEQIVICGVRRAVVYAAYLLDGFIKNSSREQ